MNYFDVWEYTWGELLEIVNALAEKERTHYKHLSSIAYTQAMLTAQFVWGGNKNTSVEECFPYWSDEEKAEMQLEKYKRIMFRHAESKKGGID